MTAPTAGDAFAAALAAEHRAIFGYGVLGARLDDAGKEAARIAEAAHRDRRDALITRIIAASATPAPAAPAYVLAAPVTDLASALRLAVGLEEEVARTWRQALAATTGDDRRVALDALISCAIQATKWREAAGVKPATVAFPGTPD